MLEEISALDRNDEAMKGDSHQCEYGLATIAGGETLLAKKTTYFFTNSWKLAATLNKQCSGNHTHGDSMEGLAHKRQESQDKLCRETCKGVIEQKEYDESLLCCTIVLAPMDLNKVTADAGCPHYCVD